MAKTNQIPMERVTVTLPKALMEEVEQRMTSDRFASVSEWVRYAIREQLSRSRSPLEHLVESDPRVAQSLEQARAGQRKPYDKGRIKPSSKAS